MSRLSRILIWNEKFDVRLVQWLCFAAAATILLLAGLALSRLTASPGEAVTGFLAASAVALSLVILGIVAPLALRQPTPPTDTQNGG